jgi:hypothetical protein
MSCSFSQVVIVGTLIAANGSNFLDIDPCKVQLKLFLQIMGVVDESFVC